jgi:MFS transporter, DHA3 family, macrolide efflux protein
MFGRLTFLTLSHILLDIPHIFNPAFFHMREHLFLKKFFIFWTSQAFSIFGSSVVGFALAWYLAKETGSATILTTAMLVNILPSVVLGPFIGPFIDRWNRKKIMIFSDLATALLTLALVVLFFTKTIQVWHVYVILAGRATGGAFQDPAMAASLAMIVPKTHLARANGFNTMLRGATNIVAPLTGAFLMEALDIQWVLAVDIITAVIAVGILFTLAIPQPPRQTLSAKPHIIEDMVQGFRYVASSRGLIMLLALIGIMSFFTAPGISLMPVFVTNYLGGEVVKLGWLQTARGVGVIAGGLVLGIWGGFSRRIVTVFTFIAVQAMAYIVFSFTTQDLFVMGLIMITATGVSGAFIGGPLNAIFQSVVARDVQGRFFALMSSITGAMMPVGLLVTGPLADAIGVRWTFLISGAAVMACAIAGSFSRNLMNLEDKKT